MTSTIDPNSITGASLLQNQLDSTRSRQQALYGAAANYLGLSPQDLRTQLESGKSLSDIATAQGKSVDGLKSALTDALQGLPGPQNANPAALVDRIVNAKDTDPQGGTEAASGHHHGHHHPKAAPPPQIESTIANFLGVSTDQLKQQLSSGNSLADIASQQGKDVAGLKQTLLSAIQGTDASGAGRVGDLSTAVDSLIQAKGGGVPQQVSTVL